MNILISGATGFIGQSLVPALIKRGHKVIALVRSQAKAHRLFGDKIQTISSLNFLNHETTIDGIINLAGEGIADKRWSESRKQLLLDSRITVTRALTDWLVQTRQKPKVFLSGSAIGYYGSQDHDECLDESASCIDGFTHQLCLQWEAEALPARDHGVRLCFLRTGIVLGRQGGALGKMLLPFKLGFGGHIGHGRQWMSWVHIKDQIAAMMFLLENNHCEGAYNITAPKAASNKDFSRNLAAVLSRPCLFPMPGFMPKLLLGEGAELLLQGQRVYPKRLMDDGFVHQYPDLQSAMRNLLA